MYNVLVEWLDEEKTRARFSLPGRTQWSAQNVSDLIQVLSEIRAEMSPPVPEEPPSVIEPLYNPRYATELHRFSGGTVFEFRHPALGWLEFLVPSMERGRISRYLAEQEETWRQFRP